MNQTYVWALSYGKQKIRIKPTQCEENNRGIFGSQGCCVRKNTFELESQLTGNCAYTIVSECSGISLCIHMVQICQLYCHDANNRALFDE